MLLTDIAPIILIFFKRALKVKSKKKDPTWVVPKYHSAFGVSGQCKHSILL